MKLAPQARRVLLGDQSRHQRANQLTVPFGHRQPRRPPAAIPAPSTNAGVGPAFTRDVLVARSVYLLLAGLGLAPANAGPDNRAPESAKRRPKAR